VSVTATHSRPVLALVLVALTLGSARVVLAACGDGTVDPGEDCDDGVANGAAGSCCQANCTRKPADTLCADTTPDDCWVAVCSSEGKCLQQGEPVGNGNPCTDTGSCFAGTCGSGTCHETTSLQPAGSACPDTAPNDCFAAQCTAEGQCDQTAAVVPAGTACGDQTATECDAADTCDAAGSCRPNFVAAGAVCTDMTPADYFAARCDGAGSCDQRAVIIRPAPTVTRWGLAVCIALLSGVGWCALRRSRGGRSRT